MEGMNYTVSFCFRGTIGRNHLLEYPELGRGAGSLALNPIKKQWMLAKSMFHT